MYRYLKNNLRFHTPSVGATISAMLASTKPMNVIFEDIAVEPEVHFIREICNNRGSLIEVEGRTCTVTKARQTRASDEDIVLNCPRDRIAAMTSVVCAILAGTHKSVFLNFPLDLCSTEIDLIGSTRLIHGNR